MSAIDRHKAAVMKELKPLTDTVYPFLESAVVEAFHYFKNRGWEQEIDSHLHSLHGAT